jgi:GH3 auxin-responsive promoter
LLTTAQLLKQGCKEEIWSKYCGFLDLDLPDFMAIQKRLLMEQIGLLGACELGQKLLGDHVPASVEEFRATVPFTTYADYLSRFADKQEAGLPVKPRWWLRTSGLTGEFVGIKWVPYTPDMVKRLGETVFALFMMAAVDGRGQFPFAEGDRLFYALAPFPYLTGGVARALVEEFPFNFLPPLDQAEQMPYEQRIQEGLRLALQGGLDHIDALAVVLVRIAEQFSSSSGGLRPVQFLLHPPAMVRLIRGLLRARMAGRKQLLPKDLWTLKGIATGGTDTELFKDQIRAAWGRNTVEGYGCTEAGGLIALQPWANEGLVFLPHLDFLEFIPMDEFARNEADPTYQPRTVLLNEVELGGIYEVVITNSSGGAFTRYRLGDLIRINALKDETLGIKTPKMVFHSKVHDIIDLAAFARLTARTIGQAIVDLGVPYVDWTARKEYHDGNPYLYVYIETRDPASNVSEVTISLDQNLRQLDVAYSELHEMMGMDPLRVVLLAPGAFKRFTQSRLAQGAELAHLKPARMQISDADIMLLMEAGN